MEDQELQNLWKNTPAATNIHVQASGLVTDLDSTLTRFNQDIKNRNLREAFAAIAVVIVFAILTYYVPGALAKTGTVICSAYGLIVLYVLHTLKQNKTGNYTLSLKEYLLSQKEYLLKERKLLNNVLYWYILPPTIGALLLFAGLNITGIRFFAMSCIVCAINTFIFFFNKTTVKKTIDPLLSQLNQSIQSLEERGSEYQVSSIK